MEKTHFTIRLVGIYFKESRRIQQSYQPQKTKQKLFHGDSSINTMQYVCNAMNTIVSLRFLPKIKTFLIKTYLLLHLKPEIAGKIQPVDRKIDNKDVLIIFGKNLKLKRQLFCINVVLIKDTCIHYNSYIYITFFRIFK